MGLLFPLHEDEEKAAAAIEQQRQYREDSIFFLMYGESGFSSREEILRMRVTDRNYHVKKLADTYERQKEEMEKSSKSSKRGR